MLFVFQHSPYGSNHAREGIEALLAALAFDQNPKALFMGDGVYQLLKNQCNTRHAGKNHEKLISSLEIYGLNEIHVESAALNSRNLNQDSLAGRTTLATPKDIATLLSNTNHVLSF